MKRLHGDKASYRNMLEKQLYIRNARLCLDNAKKAPILKDKASSVNRAISYTKLAMEI